MTTAKPVRKAAAKIYTIVRGTVDAPVDLGPLGIAPCTSGPYTILEDGIVDPKVARARVRELEDELNPGREVGGAAVFMTSRGKEYKPKPVRYSEYEILAYYAYRGADAPIAIELKDVARRPSAVKNFKDYVARIRAREEGEGIRSRIYGRLTKAELVRHDYYKGKPAGVEVIFRDTDLK